MSDARPSDRCDVRPGRREIDSAMLVSGSLPISSAEITSTISSDSFLVLIALSMDARMPTTTTSERFWSAAEVVDADPVACCALAAPLAPVIAAARSHVARAAMV